MTNETLAAHLSAEETASLQARLMDILSEEILYYTHGQSNSVSVETAQSLLESMLYCITAYLNTLPDPHAALRTQEIHEIYLKGLALISQYVEKAKRLYAVAKATRVPTDLIQGDKLGFRFLFGERVERKYGQLCVNQSNHLLC